ncbi:MAG TPA: hypothetical protein DCR63_07355 [Microbacterium sp.]|nr:hypothetical protein [Microbacterium sp.]
MDEIENVAAQLEKLAGDPLGDAVPGQVRIVSASSPVGRARYQACTLEVVVVAPGIEPVRVDTEVVTSRRYWPRVGAVLPARISASQPDRMEIDWDALAR